MSIDFRQNALRQRARFQWLGDLFSTSLAEAPIYVITVTKELHFRISQAATSERYDSQQDNCYEQHGGCHSLFTPISVISFVYCL
jgi:hypothetical protein